MKKTLLFLVIILTSAGCISPTPQAQNTMSAATPSITLTIHVPLPSENNTASSKPLECANKSSYNPFTDNTFSGDAQIWSEDNQLGIVNLESLEKSFVPNDNNRKIASLGFSPSGEQFAYGLLDETTNQQSRSFTLNIIFQDGSRDSHVIDISNIPNFDQNLLFGGFGENYWINNELIYTTLLMQTDSETASKYVYAIPIIIDVVNGKLRDDLTSSYNWDHETEMAFSPDLSHLVFQSGSKAVLLETKTEKEKWKSFDLFLSEPYSKVRWSPDGKYVAINERFGISKIILLSNEGTSQQLDLPIASEGFINFEWAPNSQALAIFHSNDETKNLYIYSLTTNSISVHCPINEPWDVLFTWSPDSQQILYGGPETYLKIFDIKTAVITQTNLQNVLPSGWSPFHFTLQN